MPMCRARAPQYRRVYSLAASGGQATHLFEWVWVQQGPRGRPDQHGMFGMTIWLPGSVTCMLHMFAMLWKFVSFGPYRLCCCMLCMWGVKPLV